MNVYDASLTNDLIIRHANSDGDKYAQEAYVNLLDYLDLVEAGTFTVPYLIKVLQHEIKCANSIIHRMRYFDPKFTRKDWTKVKIYTWSLPVIEATFFIGKEQADEDPLCSH